MLAVMLLCFLFCYLSRFNLDLQILTMSSERQFFLHDVIKKKNPGLHLIRSVLGVYGCFVTTATAPMGHLDTCCIIHPVSLTFIVSAAALDDFIQYVL